MCERAYRDTKDRVATGEIGMAKVREGLSLVRIGSPIFPEYAAWRYHRRFAARYARSVAIGAGAGIAAGALFLAIGPLSGGVFSGFTAWYAGKGCYEFLRSRGIGRLRRDDYGDAKTMDDTWVEIGRGDLDNISIVGVGANKRYDGPERWTVRISKPGAPAWYLRPSDAPGVLRRVMPGVNVAGQSEEDVGLGVELYEQWSGDVLGQLEHLVNSHSGPVKLSEEPAVSIALEMSLAEAQERQWLETELYLLAAAWKEAEELAVVADSLTLPDWVTDRVEGLRRGGG